MIDGGLNWAYDEVTATANSRMRVLLSDWIILIIVCDSKLCFLAGFWAYKLE